MARSNAPDPAVRKIPKSERNRWPVGDRTFLERQKWTILLVAAPIAVWGVGRLLLAPPGSPIALFFGVVTGVFLSVMVGFAVAGATELVGKLL